MHHISTGYWNGTTLKLFVLIMITNRRSELVENMSF